MLAALNLEEFLNETASSSPVPGGGSVAALCACIAASLSEMVAGLTIGKKGFEAVEEEMIGMAGRASELRKRLMKDIDRDADAYKAVMTAYRLPRGEDTEKKKRAAAIEKALKNAAMVPLEVARAAFELIDLAGIAVQKGNPNAVTDGAVGAMTARTAVLAALYNVKINLSTIKDNAFIESVSREVERLETEIVKKEQRIFALVKL